MNAAAPASSPSPERAIPPSANASSNSSKASAEIRAPLAKASSTPVTRRGGLHRTPTTAPTTSALDAARPNSTAVSTRQCPIRAHGESPGDGRFRPAERSGTGHAGPSRATELRRAASLACPSRARRALRPQRHRHRRQDPCEGRRCRAAVVGVVGVVGHHERAFEEAYTALGCLPPSVLPRATGHVPEMVELMRRLIDRGHAYAADGDVYFSVASFPDYGTLSGQRPSEVQQGESADTGKRDPGTSRCGRPPSPVSRAGPRRGGGGGPAGTWDAWRWPPPTSVRSSTSTAADSI